MRRASLCLLLLVLTACTHLPGREARLYDELGGEAGITRIVEGMLLNIAGDPRIVGHFRDAHIERLRGKLIEQFCVVADGPCTYTGDSMPEVHRHLHLTPADFNALVENLQLALDAQAVPVTTQNRLLARLAPLRGEIIDR